MIANGLKFEEVYSKKEGEKDKRIYLKINPELAPYNMAVLPLMKKEPLLKLSEKIFSTLSKKFRVEHDITGSIGKRYRRQDEIGTPYCLTVDFDSLEDNTVTIRDRDTMQQKRIPINAIESALPQNKLI